MSDPSNLGGLSTQTVCNNRGSSPDSGWLSHGSDRFQCQTVQRHRSFGVATSAARSGVVVHGWSALGIGECSRRRPWTSVTGAATSRLKRTSRACWQWTQPPSSTSLISKMRIHELEQSVRGRVGAPTDCNAQGVSGQAHVGSAGVVLMDGFRKMDVDFADFSSQLH